MSDKDDVVPEIYVKPGDLGEWYSRKDFMQVHQYTSPPFEGEAGAIVDHQGTTGKFKMLARVIIDD